jgi:hypothetical protein
MKRLLFLPLLCFAAFSSLYAGDSTFSVEFSATPKEKGKPVEKIRGENLLPDNSFSFPFRSPEGNSWNIQFILNRDETTNEITSVLINIYDLKQISPQGPVSIFTNAFPYKPNELLAIFEDNRSSFSFRIKPAAAKPAAPAK